jgi:Haem-binding domain
MKRQISKKTFRWIHWKAIVAPLVLWSSLIVVGYSDGGKQHNGAKEKPVPIDTAAADYKTDEALALFSASLDSVYAAIGVSYNAVEPMLKNSCYDCHSAQAVFPWYQSLPIIKQMIANDIKEGRSHLDLDQGFPFAGHASQLAQLEEIRKEVAESEMPLFAYRMMHWGTLIEDEKQDTLFNWIDKSSAAIKEVYSRYQMQLPAEGEHGEESDGDDHDDDDHDDDGE